MAGQTLHTDRRVLTSVVEIEVRGAGALPQLPSTKTENVWLPPSEEVKYQAPFPPIQGADLEWDNPLHTDDLFTPDSHYVDIALRLAQKEK